ncbi:hypothetical protein DFH08DRAFT_964848 [Mycena albidolilacea]|uniref:Zn(2)-C6 fungal-type domain-containing protein n=1 Tax=Mycena albidolilacea TaxID=1033008 RepID=A0AAD6ZTN0_9AGAR|nr:hypothetical protein DFH08DRAFT_964848 [Mycena albidolilacea]
MPSSNPVARTPQNAPKRKIRCITTEQPPTNPCARCTKKGLPCEYMAVAPDDSTPSQSPDLVPSALPNSSRHSRHSSFQAPARPSSAASNDFSRVLGMAPPLPYTGPPPVHRRPRYSGAQYPDLSLSGSGSSHSTHQAQYYPTPTKNQTANQGLCQAYQYMTDHPAPAGQVGMYPPGTENYGQMHYYGNTPMPDYQWPPHQE